MNAKKLVLALFYSSIFHTTRRNVSVKKKMRSFEQYDGRINEIIIHKIRLTSVNDRKKKSRTKSTEKNLNSNFRMLTNTMYRQRGLRTSRSTRKFTR